jgi:prepilin-type N-terminal cleavage/methylation domain-containing protein
MPIKERDKRKSPQAGEAGFTLVEMIIVLVLASILSVFVFQIFTKCLKAQISMQERKERSDDAVLVLERISREIRAADTINNASNNKLIIVRADTGKAVKFILNTSTNKLRRQSADTVSNLPSDSDNSSGNNKIMAENVTYFLAEEKQSYFSSVNLIQVDITLEDGSSWRIKTQPRNYGL